MAKEVPYDEQLVDCPRGCGYQVKRKKLGAAHRIADPLNPGQLIWCE